LARHQWLTPIILSPQEAEIRRIEFQGQPKKNESETLSQKYPTQKRAGGVAQVVEWLPSKQEAMSLNPSTETDNRCSLKSLFICFR
jgi:hypothetical protein